MSNENYIIEVDNVTARFNKSTQKIDSIKEYFIKLVKRELMFQEFLALQDISFKIKKGEAWGLIGTNGAGKSTLLKVISGILKPYKGTVKVKGSIAPLIELGAGFDSNLTARENIFLNGTVLGHSKKFLEEHFDEIVDFAELHDFLDSPIKNYSSGMKARLGFSVATMVNPDVLIVDEILSVGDYKFRKKCNQRMDEMLEGGITLLYVSHSIASVRALCDHAIWLNKGKIVMAGDCDDVCDAYMETQESDIKKRKAVKEEQKKSAATSRTAAAEIRRNQEKQQKAKEERIAANKELKQRCLDKATLEAENPRSK